MDTGNLQSVQSLPHLLFLQKRWLGEVLKVDEQEMMALSCAQVGY